MKNKYIKFFVKCSLVIITMVSCTEFLAEKPTAQFTADFVYNTPEGLEAGVVALYTLHRSFWQNLSNNGSNAIVIDSRDDLTIPRGGEISNYGRMRNGTTVENSGVFGDYWRHYYRLIDRSNALIQAAEAINNIDENRRAQILSEAKFFRGHSVFILYKLFNNIYVTTEPTTPQNSSRIINDKSSKEEIFNLIKSDLTYAIENLTWTTAQPGRVGLGVARHIRAEVALWEQDWQEAKIQAEAVIESGTHRLLNNTGLVFGGDLNHSEALWTLQWRAQINGVAHRINFNLMPNYAELIPGSRYTIEQGGRGFGWLTLNNYFRDLLNEDPNDTRIKGTYYVQDYVYNDPNTIPADKVLGEKIIHPQWQEFAATAANRNFWFIRLNAGCKKYFPDNGIPTENNHFKNIMLYRLAETYFFASEANMRLGNTTLAIEQLNAVRTRANASPVSEITLEAILDEQARELAFEGRRWYMLKRTGKLYDHIITYAGYGLSGDKSPENSTAGGANNTKEKPLPYRNDARAVMQPHMVNWVIPLSVINLLGPDYPQNEGY
jgi:starch-binding outer membrane protein, SusD/RagB family